MTETLDWTLLILDGIYMAIWHAICCLTTLQCVSYILHPLSLVIIMDPSSYTFRKRVRDFQQFSLRSKDEHLLNCISKISQLLLQMSRVKIGQKCVIAAFDGEKSKKRCLQYTA